MTISIHLLGRPQILRGPDEGHRFRSRKSWGVLAYLVLSDHLPSRNRLSTLLFEEADDPLRALRWALSEIRIALAEDGEVGGDPVQLTLAPGSMVDVDVVTKGSASDAVSLPNLGDELLAGLSFGRSPAFESWLLAEQRYLAAASEAVLHEASLSALSHGATADATRLAARLVAMNPLDENHQALLIHAYVQTGDHDAAAKQLAACVALYKKEYGSPPGPVVFAAAKRPPEPTGAVSHVALEAMIESGKAAVSAGSIEAGIELLRSAVAGSTGADDPALAVAARIALAGAFIGSLRGLDEAGTALLHEARLIARSSDLAELEAEAKATLGHVDFLRARYDRSERWYKEALQIGGQSEGLAARALTGLGAIASDRAQYREASEFLDRALSAARASGDGRREAYALSMVGRIALLRGDLDAASMLLKDSVHIAEQTGWLSFVPWPQTLLGEAEASLGHTDDAHGLLDQAFARACQLGDPCWEGAAGRGLAILAERQGTVSGAFELLLDARARCNRLADTYHWMDVAILDTLCDMGRRHDHPDTRVWVETMRTKAARTDMRELIVRSLMHGAALGFEGDGDAAVILAELIDNPELSVLIARM